MKRRARSLAATGLSLVLVVVLVSAAIRLGQAASPPIGAGVLTVLRALHRTAASLEVVIVLWLGWIVWRAPSERATLIRGVALAAAMTIMLSVLGILAGQAPRPAAAMANLLGGLALAAVFAGALRTLRDSAVQAVALVAVIAAGLLAVQCLLGARLSVFPGAASSAALPAHAMLGIALAFGAGWLARRVEFALRRLRGIALAILVPVTGFTALQYESSAPSAFAHAAAVALLVVVAAYTRIRPT